MEILKIAHIRTDFPTKFGIPRQSGLVKKLKGEIIFEPEYRSPDAIRGIEEFTHLWIVWGFSENGAERHSLTVRPPRLGGNVRKGVFATRSPFRPNGLALSLVKLDGVRKNEKYGHILEVSGVDMVDNTPIYDVKPYLPLTDTAPDAHGGFADEKFGYELEVKCDTSLLEALPEDKRELIIEILKQDPRPAYIDDPERVFGFPFAGCEIKFRVDGTHLTVINITKKSDT